MLSGQEDGRTGISKAPHMQDPAVKEIRKKLDKLNDL